MKQSDAVRSLGPALRARRDELGLSLDEISVATRIPVAHLRAIELERPQDLPDGPYAAAYVRLLQEHLDLAMPKETISEAQVEDRAEAATAVVPLQAVRAVAALSAIAVVALIAVQAWQRFVPERQVVIVVPDQHVVVTAKRSGRVRAVVDGVVVHDAVLPGGRELTLDGHERVEVSVPSTSTFSVQWNGESMVPQGLQDHPRTLIFVDDVGPKPEPVDTTPAPGGAVDVLPAEDEPVDDAVEVP